MENDKFNAGSLDQFSSIDEDTNTFDDEFEYTPDEPVTTKPTDDDDSYFEGDDDSYVKISSKEINNLLKANGIKDINKIKWQEEDGTEVYKSLHDLTDQEKLKILQGDSSDYDLDDDEVNLINYMRTNKLDSESLEDLIANKYVEEYRRSMEENYEPETYLYKVDDLSDQELYMADLRSKYPSATEEELIKLFDTHTQDESLFAKTVKDLRNYYRNLEDAEIQRENEERDYQIALEQQQYDQSIMEAVNKFDRYSEIGMDQEDKQEIYNLLTSKDEKGIKTLEELFSNPDNLVKAVWAITKGENAVNFLVNHYKQEITKSRNNSPVNTYNNYRTYSKPTVSNNKNNSFKTLEDLD